MENYVDGDTLGHLETAKQDALDLFVHILELRKVHMHSYFALTIATSARCFKPRHKYLEKKI